MKVLRLTLSGTPSGTYVPTYVPCVIGTVTAYVIEYHAPFPRANQTTICRVQNSLRSLGRCWPTCKSDNHLQGSKLLTEPWPLLADM